MKKRNDIKKEVKKIKFNPDIYVVNDPGSHLKEEYQTKIFLEKIIQVIQK